MRVLIYEPDHRGHHFAYLAHLLPELSELAGEVMLATTPSGAASPQFAIHLAPFAARFSVDTSMGEKHRGNQLRFAFQSLDRLRRVAARIQPDHVYIPYGDTVVQSAGAARLAGIRVLPKRAESEVLLMRGGYQYPAESRFRRWRNHLAPRLIDRGPWTRIHHLNPDDLTVLKRHAADPGRYRLMPDPVEAPAATAKAEARRRLGIPESGRYIGCAGGIDRRKGMHLLVRAFAASQHKLRADDRLLLAGPMEPEIRAAIAAEAGLLPGDRLVLIDRPLTAKEFDDALAALDVVATPYPAHPHSASIVTQAAVRGRPVLGSSIGWMHRTIRDFQLGATCNVRDMAELCAQLVRSLEVSDTFHPSAISKRFVAFHSPENFRAHWTMRLRERLGLPTDGNMVTWKSVLDAANDGRPVIPADHDSATSTPRQSA